MFQQYFLLIVLLNFLIAIISQVYEYDQLMSINNIYTQKCEMNREVDYQLRFYGLRRNYEMYLLRASIEDLVDQGEEEWSGLVKKMNDFQVEQT